MLEGSNSFSPQENLFNKCSKFLESYFAQMKKNRNAKFPILLFTEYEIWGLTLVQKWDLINWKKPR